MDSRDFLKMKEDYKRRMNSGNKNTFLFPIISVILIIIGIFILNKTNEFMSTAKTTTAKIYTERNPYEFDENAANYYIDYAEYTVDGVKYYQQINTSTSYFSIGSISYTKTRNGEEIIIYYNPNNPSEIQEASSNKLGYFLIIFGALILILSLGTIVYEKLVNEKIITPKIYGENIQNKILNSFDKGSFNYLRTANIIVRSIVKFVFICIGILILLFGILSINIDSSFSKNAKETTAIVTRIENTEERDIDNRRYIQKHVYVKYEVNNQKYEEKLDEVSGYEKNDKITIYYNPENPNEIRTSNEKSNSGIYISIVGIAMITYGIISKNNQI